MNDAERKLIESAICELECGNPDISRAILGSLFSEVKSQQSRSFTPRAPNMEAISAKVHESWMDMKRAMGFHGPNSDCDVCEVQVGGFRCSKFHADMIPYEQLTDAKKELDRATVRTVLKAMSDVEHSESGQLL